MKDYTSLELRSVMSLLSYARKHILARFPFYGYLLMRLEIALAACGTAATDMKHILFDPAFVLNLSDEREVEVLMLHEVLHCVLKHPIRRRGRDPERYNIAADIVVNSFILELYGTDTLTIAGEELVHIAPDGSEGRYHTVDEVYDMLPSSYFSSDDVHTLNENGSLDDHQCWSDGLPDRELPDVEQEWTRAIKEASEKGPVSSTMARAINLDHAPGKTDWRAILEEYLSDNDSHYSYMHPDKRFLKAPYLMPGYQRIPGELLSNILIAVDISGSVSDDLLSRMMSEIISIARQVNAEGKILCFDNVVYPPFSFDDADQLKELKRVGCGGTDFLAAFNYIATEIDEAPSLILFVTDGYDTIPDEQCANDVPVVWLIFSDVTPAWGKVINLDEEEFE